ncbi:MAG: hypothetical protein ACRYF3_09540 [Janthinobacterium lividum]
MGDVLAERNNGWTEERRHLGADLPVRSRLTGEGGPATDTDTVSANAAAPKPDLTMQALTAPPDKAPRGERPAPPP